jgi:uncharacterized RDD family membrane protein YckC
MRTLEPASWWKRIGAIIYDTLILSGVLMIAGFAVLPFTGGRAVPAGALWFQAYLLLIVWAYFALSWWRGAQTLGARAWRLEVRTIDGHRPGILRATARAILSLLSLCSVIGLVWGLLDRERQCVHDRLSGTQLLQAVG